MSSAAMKSQTSRDEADIWALVETIDKAHHSKDAAAIVAPYAQDAVVCDLAPPLCHRGTDLQAKAGVARHGGKGRLIVSRAISTLP